MSIKYHYIRLLITCLILFNGFLIDVKTLLNCLIKRAWDLDQPLTIIATSFCSAYLRNLYVKVFINSIVNITCAVLCFVAPSCPTLCDPMDCNPPGSSVHGDSPGENTGVGCQALLQGIFPTQESNPGLPHCSQILYCLSQQGSQRILEWVAWTFSRGTSWPRSRTGVPALQEDSLLAKLPGKTLRII